MENHFCAILPLITPPERLRHGVMKLSKKAEYAMRALLAMARSPDIPTFAIQDIAASERIPLKFLEQILLTLKNGGLLKSKRGVGGGYQFHKSAARVTLGEIMSAPTTPTSYRSHGTLRSVSLSSHTIVFVSFHVLVSVWRILMGLPVFGLVLIIILL